MYRYRLYGLTIVSDLKFPQLVPESNDMQPAPVVYVEACEIPEEIKTVTDKKYVFGRQRSWLVNRTAWIMVEEGKYIRYQLTGGGMPAYLQTYILGYGMSMLALQRDILAIHCSAVADESGAVLIAGESGAGKSTVTTAFLEKGYRLLADDMAFVETRQGGAVAHPAFPYQKLCRNVASEKGYQMEDLIYIDEDKDKYLVPYEGEFSVDAVPVKAFIMLGVTEDAAVTVKKVTGFDRFYIYANNLFLRHLLKGDKYSPEIGQKCIEMAAVVPTFCIGRPRIGDTTSEVIAKAFQVLFE